MSVPLRSGGETGDHPGHAALDPTPLARGRWRRGRRLSDGSTLFWWKELVIVVALDLVYETVGQSGGMLLVSASGTAVTIEG